MNKGKKIIIIFVGFLILVGSLTLFLYKRPFPLVKSGEGYAFRIMCVEYGGERIEDHLDEQAVMDVLSHAVCRRNVFPYGRNCFAVTEDLIKIWVWDSSRDISRDILLYPSERIFWEGNRFAWQNNIINGEEIYQ